MSYKVETANGTILYYKAKDNLILHREDGPAKIIKGKTPEYWLNGVQQVHYFKIDEIKNCISPYCYELLKDQHNWRFYNDLIVNNITDKLNNKKAWFWIKDGIVYCPFDMPQLNHKIAHIVEMEDYNRLLKPDFGFKNNAYKIKDPKHFYRALVRETKVKAIQCHLEETTEYVLFKGACAETKYRNGGITKRLSSIKVDGFYDLASCFIPFGRFRKREDLLNYMIGLTKKTYEAYSFDRIRNEFNKRMNFINNNM